MPIFAQEVFQCAAIRFDPTQKSSRKAGIGQCYVNGLFQPKPTSKNVVDDA
jgi:hypothetical protein